MSGELEEVSVAIGELRKGQELGAGDSKRIEAMVRQLGKELKQWRIAESQKQARRHEDNLARMAAIEQRLGTIEGDARDLVATRTARRRHAGAAAKVLAALVTVAAAAAALVNFFAPPKH